jgi:hypothetical protein
MEKSEMLNIALAYTRKGYSQEEMKWGDACSELKGEEGDRIKDQIADYMDEIGEIGRTAFYEKYKEFKPY